MTKPLDATITLPGSKSITNRALVAAAIADGTSLLKNVLLADDTRIMIEALRALGIAITVDEAECLAEVTGCRGQLPVSGAELFCGNSGTTMRFCAALTALGHGRYQLDGIERMRQRPIGQLIEVLRVLGVGIEYVGHEGFPPITVYAGGLHGGQVSFHSPRSSQFVSALLLAAPYATRDLLIEVTGDIPSTPYLRTTTAVMEWFGVAVIEQYRAGDIRFIVEAPQRYQGVTLTIEPDASNAMYFLAAAAVAGGCVTVEGLGTNSIQGDNRFLDLLERIGCR
ncbi:MAG: 3-phosphoshikimate 1-carboxyvinyltransferase, partial [Planctomycetes bacterium]|nr:3-phosphoshikimate 1-carboxyvinyltransferase [Planctomycetota bacterium]